MVIKGPKRMLLAAAMHLLALREWVLRNIRTGEILAFA
jgi:hypothetical protein